MPTTRITSNVIQDGTIIDADIKADAGINPSKLGAGTLPVGTTVNPSQLNAGALPSGITTLATGSTTARSLANRFADVVNVKDFGAVGDGIADDTLALYRAIVASTTYPERTGTPIQDITLTSPTQTLEGVEFPIGYTQGNRKWIFLPDGVYRITQPLPIHYGFKMYGAINSVIKPDYTNGAFNAFETLSVYKNRVHPYGGTYENNHYTGFITIKDIVIRPGNISGNYTSIQRKDDITWYSINMISARWSYASGNSGDNFFTFNTPSATGTTIALPVGTLFKFGNNNQVYTVTGSELGNKKFFISPNLPQNITNEKIYIGYKGTFGFFIEGGSEGSTIDNILIEFMSGAGFYINFGSPGPVIKNCMVNFCKVAYWSDAFTQTFIQPSGDVNEILFRIGYYNASTFGTVIGTKDETFDFSNRYQSAGLDYKKATFQTSAPGGGPLPKLTIIGGTFNDGGPASVNDGVGHVDNSAFIETFEYDGARPTIVLQAIGRLSNWGDYVVKRINAETDAIIENFSVKRFGNNAQSFGSISFEPPYFSLSSSGTENINNITGSNFYLQTRDNYQCGILLDQGSGITGFRIPWTRSGTVVTFTQSSHKFQVGDGLVVARQYLGTNFQINSSFAINGIPIIQAITSTTYSITVLDSGSLSGEARIKKISNSVFHGINSAGTHIIQSPKAGTFPNEFIKFISNLKEDLFALINHFVGSNAPVPCFWTKYRFGLGGTIASPSVVIQSGAGDPQSNPDLQLLSGSIYLRTDGGNGTTLYVRENNMWVPK